MCWKNVYHFLTLQDNMYVCIPAVTGMTSLENALDMQIQPFHEVIDLLFSVCIEFVGNYYFTVPFKSQCLMSEQIVVCKTGSFSVTFRHILSAYCGPIKARFVLLLHLYICLALSVSLSVKL